MREDVYNALVDYANASMAADSVSLDTVNGDILA